MQPGGARAELHAELERAGVARLRRPRGCRRRAPDAARAGLVAAADRHRHARRGRLAVGAVVDGPAPDRQACPTRRRGSCSSSSPARWPGARSCRRRSRPRRRRPAPPPSVAVPVTLTVAPGDTVPPAAGAVIVEVGRGGVGGRRRGGQARHQRGRLGAHVGEQVDRRLLHPRVGGGARRGRGWRRGPRPTGRCRRRTRARRRRRGTGSGCARPCPTRRSSRGRPARGRWRPWSRRAGTSPPGREPLSGSVSHS